MDASRQSSYSNTSYTSESSKNRYDRWHWTVFLQAYFVSIAAILGIGILGLPVTLSHSGMQPLILNLIISFFAQFVCIEDDSTPLTSETNNTEALAIIEHKLAELKDLMVQDKDQDETQDDEISLHTISKLFLPFGAYQLFDILVIATFLSILISFALAGGQAYSEITELPLPVMISIFVWSWAAVIIFLRKIVQPFVSVLTIVKCIALVVTDIDIVDQQVSVTFYVGLKIDLPIHNNWSYVGSSFLMTTVSLGGIILIMPMLFARIRFNTREVVLFNTAIISALGTVVILNLLWSYAVLGVVPQRCVDIQPTIMQPDNQNTTLAGHCNISLAWAERNGKISTVPLTEILRQHYPKYDWIASLVEIFIVISITVSFLTLGSALRHTLCGTLDTIWNYFKARMSEEAAAQVEDGVRTTTEKNWLWITKILVYILTFGIAFIVAMFNPKAFIAILSSVGSFFINLQAGLFIPMMIYKARRHASSNLKTPCPMGKILYILHFLMAFYFLFAVVYDIVIVIIQSVHKS
ncbi:uncharacterized protein TRIADDRAFT_55223 [Trichoplax adhaerens]|uniref:Amino acid transporter transmembrane domain-containing protein n=1 Tax=Trichoplax adhaerens TaxID=10228 RepID=B3RUB3_TRIAD|nr:hypothetical protein TRIADDRAFT_55223 [Trichoplax adhaerens]EDV25304.1 hypothetical protein TRIADDRAFT_55223 [Trichoplax adhaerens]|eukprot:XP_002111337.1 hypothetical protein TRIADDRAFT_55223 [Trichoplax adhaerens]